MRQHIHGFRRLTQDIGYLVLVVAIVSFLLVSLVVWVSGRVGLKIDDMRYEVLTNTRAYYTDTYELNGTVHNLTNWFEMRSGKWRYHKGTLHLDESVFGDIQVRSNR